ncbi:MAG: hypothetical protein PHT02_07045 [Tissierellia bacterium]|nr:hypothetical protein [Tissierellia bacterium]
MRTKSVKKAAFIFMKTAIEPDVVVDNRIRNENIFSFDSNAAVSEFEAEYRALTANQKQLVDDKDLWKLEKFIGILKKKCVAWKKNLPITDMRT